MRSVRTIVALVLTALIGPLIAPAGAFDDAHFGLQWGLTQTGAPAAWATSTGQDVRIGIVDTGIDLAHEDLAGRVVAQANCIGAKGDAGRCGGSAQDDNGHGTHVAGIAAAIGDNGVGIAGVAPAADLVVAKVLNADGSGDVADVVAGIRWVVDNGAQVVNLSLGDPAFVVTALFGTPLKEAIDYAWHHGTVPVLAAGNTKLLGLGSSEYGQLNALVVGATGPDDRVTSYSSPTGNAKWSIVAPGGAGPDGAEQDGIYSTIWSADGPNRYTHLSGTSMAAPHVAGAAALLLATGAAPEQVVTRLLASADTSVDCGPNSPTCAGRLDVARAVANVGAA